MKIFTRNLCAPSIRSRPRVALLPNSPVDQRGRDDAVDVRPREGLGVPGANGKIRFQSRFTSTTVQPFALASSSALSQERVGLGGENTTEPATRFSGGAPG